MLEWVEAPVLARMRAASSSGLDKRPGRRAHTRRPGSAIRREELNVQVRRRGRGLLARASLVAVVLTPTLAFPSNALVAGIADTTPPTVPGGLSASVAARRHIELTWHASTDDLVGAIATAYSATTSLSAS